MSETPMVLRGVLNTVPEAPIVFGDPKTVPKTTVLLRGTLKTVLKTTMVLRANLKIGVEPSMVWGGGAVLETSLLLRIQGLC